MRRQYRALGLRRIAKPLWLVRALWRFIAIPRSTRDGRAHCGPAFASLIVNYRCNLICEFCDAWRSASGPRPGVPLEPAEIAKLLADLARIGTLAVGVTGGEPLLRADIADILAAIRRHGMLAHLNTNGTLLDDSRARDVLAARPESINVSVDASQPEIHDRLRGKPGAWSKAVDGIETLLRLRDRGRSPRISMISVVDVHTDVAALVALAKRLGVDSIGFIPRHDFTAMPDESPGAVEPAALQRSRLLELAAVEPIIDSSPAYLSLFHQALIGSPHDVRCHAAASHLAVDVFGDVFVCMPFNERGRAYANVRETPIVEIWNGSEHRRMIRETASCRDCFWNCHTELNLALERSGIRSC